MSVSLDYQATLTLHEGILHSSEIYYTTIRHFIDSYKKALRKIEISKTISSMFFWGKKRNMFVSSAKSCFEFAKKATQS